MLEDKMLTLKLKLGDQKAMRIIYEKYKDDLLTIAFSMLNKKDQAQELLCDVFITFTKNIRDFELYGNLKNYFLICLINRVRDKLRTNMYQVVGLDSSGPLDTNASEPHQNAVINKRSRSAKAAPYPSQCVCLIFQLIAPFKPLHAPRLIDHPTLSGKKWVTLAAHLNLQNLLGRTGDKGITTRANYLSIGKILGMNLIFHPAS